MGGAFSPAGCKATVRPPATRNTAVAASPIRRQRRRRSSGERTITVPNA